MYKYYFIVFVFNFFCTIGEDLFTIMEEDLRICSVKPAYDAERRFCFEVLSPNKYILFDIFLY